MDEDAMLGLISVLFIPFCGLCCVGAFCYENLCKKKEVIEEESYNQLV